MNVSHFCLILFNFKIVTTYFSKDSFLLQNAKTANIQDFYQKNLKFLSNRQKESCPLKQNV